MTPDQRRVTFALCVIVGLTLLVAAGLTFLISPMAEGLGLGDDVVEDSLVVPAVASLIVVFIAGRLGDRFGQRRTIVAASACFTLGSLVLAAAQNTATVELGLALCGIGAVVIQVVAVSLLQQTTPEGPARVSAFTSYGAVFPLAFLVLPVVTAGALGHISWRWIPVGWAIAGVVMAVLGQALLTSRPRPLSPGDMVTPVLAGLALAAIASVLGEVDNAEVEAHKLVIGILVFLVASGLCYLLVRRSSSPGFSLRPLRLPMLMALLLAVMVVSLVQILSYVCIVLEYFYGLTALQASLVILPAQVGAIVGAKVVASFAVRRWGVARAGRGLVLANGITMLPLVLMTPSTPVWFLVAVSTVFSCAGMGALTVLNIDVMGRAPADSTGAVSAFRIAASTVGTALGMTLVGAIILSSVQVDAGDQNVALAQLEQMSFALRVSGVLCFVVALGAWALLVTSERRKRPRAGMLGGTPTLAP